ncbi:MAG: amidohydrolase [Spirochaetaceae bacterium]|jgi:predicted amidohydrolase YtcJ|nr:amidohydrolase [Spirochaetaceae bacterium]
MRVYQKGVFISCEEDDRVFSVLIEDGGKILYTGDEVPPAYRGARRVDMEGRAVIPAFADTHLHFESYALFLSTVDVRGVKDFDEMRQMLRSYAASHRGENFIPAYGCSAHIVAERRLPERADLDRMIETPLLLVKYDGHAAVVNSALIRELPAEVRSDPGFDAETGWLYQNAFYKGVNYVTSKISPLKILASMQRASAELARAGVGYLHTVEGIGFKNDMDITTILAARHGLAQYFKVFFQTTDVEQVTRRGLKQIGGCFKLALDGCLGSEDAAIYGGYHNNPQNTGFLLYSQQEVNDFCVRANRAGLQIAMHAIGDAAVDQALTAYEAALTDLPREDHRHIIIHADLIPPPMIDRAAKLGIGIALQPNFLRWPQEPPEYLKKILGPRADELLPLRSLLDKGILVSAGSDAPCTLPNPIESLYNCCNHPNASQRIDIGQALKMHTLWAAKMGFDEDRYGSLAAGKAANFVVLNENPLSLPGEKLRDLRITAVYLGGRLCNPAQRPSFTGFLGAMIGGYLGGKYRV